MNDLKQIKTKILELYPEIDSNYLESCLQLAYTIGKSDQHKKDYQDIKDILK